MMRKSILFILTVFVFEVSGLHGQLIIDRIIGHVGGEIILYSDVEKNVSYMTDSGWPDDESTYCLVIEDLLMRKLLINQAKIDSVLVLDAEVEAQLEARIANILRNMGNDMQRFEQIYDKTVDQVRDEMREPMKNQMLSQRMQEQIMDAVEATPSEVVEFYNRIPKDSLPYFNSEVEISEIVYTIPYNDSAKAQALGKINSLRDRVMNGEDFGELATIFSDDPGSARQNGNLGLQPRGTFVPEFEAVAYNLEIGEISYPVETQFGYHIIKLNRRQGNMLDLQHILIKPKLTYEDVEKGKLLLDSLKGMILKDSISFESIVRDYSDESERSYSNAGRIMNPNTGNNFWEVGELDSDVYFAIADLEPGEISDPVEFDSPARDKKLKLFLLHSRTKPHQATLELDYSRIQKLASEEKRFKKFEEWLKKRIKTTYIDIEKDFVLCDSLEDWVGTGP